MSDLHPVPGRSDLHWRPHVSAAGRMLSIDLLGVADGVERADATSYAPGVRLTSRLRPVASLSIPRHVHCPDDEKTVLTGPVPLDAWLPRALRWQDRPRMSGRRRALFGALAARAGAPCRLRIHHGDASLQVETSQGWRTDTGPLGMLAWSIADLLGLHDGHVWTTDGALPTHGPAFVPLAPGPEEPLRSWIASGPGIPDWRRDGLLRHLDAPGGPVLRAEEDPDDGARPLWREEVGGGWVVQAVLRPGGRPDVLLLRQAEGYGRDGGRLGPVRRLCPLVRLGVPDPAQQDPARMRAQALATARALAGPGGDARTRALEALLPSDTDLATRIHLPVPPEDWRYGDPAPGLPPAAAAAVQDLLDRPWGKATGKPVATPAFSPTGYHDGLAQPTAWNGPWRTPAGLSAHARIAARRDAPPDLAALGPPG